VRWQGDDMTTYRIRGQLKSVESNNNDVSGFRVELWDDDQRFDDRLGSGKTDSTGLFEFKFTDDDFQQDFLDLDQTPDLYFNVYQGRRRIGFTEPSKDVKLPSEPFKDKPETVVLNEDGSKSKYTIKSVKIELIEDEETEKRATQQQEFQETRVRVYDILPTSNQIVGTGTQTSLTPVDNRGGSLQQIVDSALSEVLGRNLNSDAKAFLSTLTQTFTPKQTNGRTEYVWTARTYAAMQNDLGGTVSGAQASLYHRAKAALNDALPLLDKLYPLDPAADQQNMDAMRAIIRTELIELVEELGATGGPRVQRVDSLFQLLIGSAEDTNSSENVGGQMKNLADVFGLNRSHINTVDQEQDYGNFLIVRDYIVSLKDSWNAYVQDTGGGAYVGTQLVLLSQALSVVAESVQEVYRIMDLVFLGPAERQTVLIDFTLAKYPPPNSTNSLMGTNTNKKPVAFPLPDGTEYPEDELSKLVPPMSVEGLLKWAWRFGAEEGPTLAKAGGKLGIAQAIAETAEKLMILVQAASFTPVRNTAFRREGVLRALRDLAFQLYQVQRLAAEIIPPPTNYQPNDIDQISPAPNSNQTRLMRRITPSR
jgi:hypothetical protein